MMFKSFKIILPMLTTHNHSFFIIQGHGITPNLQAYLCSVTMLIAMLFNIY